MELGHDIDAIRAGIREGRFANEQSVSQGIVLRLLAALGWPVYDTQIVWPEYSLSGRRVDFALCHPATKPIAIIEVKQIGQGDGAERQLFEYAFHQGVPLAILTDGREWNFFLPGEQGDYGERRVYKLELVERELPECISRLQRYLLYSAVVAGTAIQNAREDYRNVSKDRQMRATLPQAWSKLLNDEDDMLIEIVADKVESLCGFKPDPDMVLAYLSSLTKPASAPVPVPTRAERPGPIAVRPQTTQVEPKSVTQDVSGVRIGYELNGVFHPARNAIDVLRQVLEEFTKRDTTFAERFMARPHGKSRRYLAQDRSHLYTRPDLCVKHSTQLTSGWWISTNHSRNTIDSIIQLASDVAGVQYGKALIAHLGSA